VPSTGGGAANGGSSTDLVVSATTTKDPCDGAPGDATRTVVPPNLAITFDFPCEWEPTPYHGVGYPTAWDGSSGFVIFGEAYREGSWDPSTTADPFAARCESDAHHLLRPFGSEPIVRMTTVQQHRTCSITPSDDAPLQVARQDGPAWAWHELLIEYLVPVDNGHPNERILAMNVTSDSAHIDAIAATMQFLEGH
jgi:TolB protein